MDVSALLNPPPAAAPLHAQAPSLPASPGGSPPPPPLAPQLPLPQKRRVLRATGQAHRDRERESMDELVETVRALKLDNLGLLAQAEALILNVAEPQALREALRHEVPAAAGAHTYRLSTVLAARIGVRYITGAMALLLLDVIAGRRKLPPASSKTPPAPQAAPAPADAFAAIFHRALADVRRDAQRLADLHALEPILCELELRAILIDLHATWADAEFEQLAPPPIAASYLPAGPTAGPAPPISKKLSRPKKCHRCGKLRSAGFGHPRSICNAPEDPSGDADLIAAAATATAPAPAPLPAFRKIAV